MRYKTSLRKCHFCDKPGAWFVPELGKGYAHPEGCKKHNAAQQPLPDAYTAASVENSREVT
jgi:hypothetical protein